MPILIHSSKTMRPSPEHTSLLADPVLLPKAIELGGFIQTMTPTQLATVMKLSDKLATTTFAMAQHWNGHSRGKRMAIDSFLGDIYSGLQVAGWTKADRAYANQTLRILSGLYGIIQPEDGIAPYRLELGYKLPNKKYTNLYDFWGSSVADQLPTDTPIINLAAIEYSKLVTKYVDEKRIFTPLFLTCSPKTGVPTFVVVHAKIARGAFANWLITNRVETVDRLSVFSDLGYRYDAALSSKNSPAFVCDHFGGLGLSVRLT